MFFLNEKQQQKPKACLHRQYRGTGCCSFSLSLSLSLSIFFKEQQRLSTQGQGIGIPGTPYLRLSEDRYFSYMTHL